MIFDIKIWNDYRNRARAIGDYIMSFKDEAGWYVGLSRHQQYAKIREITDILNECNAYMNACGLKMLKPNNLRKLYLHKEV